VPEKAVEVENLEQARIDLSGSEFRSAIEGAFGVHLPTMATLGWNRVGLFAESMRAYSSCESRWQFKSEVRR
jgi:hypothetical protein